MSNSGPIRDANYRNNRKTKNKPALSSRNKPVIDALRDNLPGTKIWVCKDDTIEVNRKPLNGFVATPADNVAPEAHARVLIAAIKLLLEDVKSDKKIQDEVDEVVEIVFLNSDQVLSGDKIMPPHISDPDTWYRATEFVYPSGFQNRLCEMYGFTPTQVRTITYEYLKFMYIKSLHPTSVPSENIAKVLRLHIQYTKSFGDLCGILEKRIAYEPFDSLDLPVQRVEYVRTTNRYYAEFTSIASGLAWDGPESSIVSRILDPRKFWIFRKFWKR